MKLIILVGILGVFESFTIGVQDDLFASSSDMIQVVMHEMPLKSMDIYEEHFYPKTIRMINRKLYHRKSRPQPMPERKLRNIKLNRYLTIPNDRKDGIHYSSFPFLAGNDTRATNFVLYNVKDGSGSLQFIDIHSPDTACIFGMSEKNTAVKAKACREDVENMMWDLVPNKYGDYWVKQRGTDLCLAPVLTMGHPTRDTHLH